MRMRAVSAILALLTAASADASRAARAEECLASPNGQSPSGKHWYYRIDRSTHRHCWYLGALDGRRHHAASARAAASTARRADPDPPEPAAAAPTPAPQAVAQPAVGTRWPSEAPGAAADGAQPQNRVADAGVAVLPDRVVARPVPVERVTREAAPAKPPQPATVRLAAAPPPAASPAAATGTSGALPAALFGMALLLAVLGVILVRTRRRFMVRVTEPAEGRGLAFGRDEHVARVFMRIRGLREALGMNARADEETRPARSLHQILADAEVGDALSARHADAFAPARNPDEREARPLPANDAAPDIAAATLQPAIDPLPPEPMPAPDVEASLRQLLAAWERRAA